MQENMSPTSGQSDVRDSTVIIVMISVHVTGFRSISFWYYQLGLLVQKQKVAYYTEIPNSSVELNLVR